MFESEWVERARQGDDAAWEDLMRGHQEAVFRLAYLMLGSAADAEDVAQETFIRAYRYLPHYDPARPWRPWLLGIAANLARNRRRSFGRYWFHLKRLARLDVEASIDPENAVSEQHSAQVLWDAVRRLSSSDQEVIYLRYFLELSIDETAATLNIAPGTVKSRLSRALGRLRGVVQQEYPLLWQERNAHE
ncbi:MAG: RNA polymerase sigma factor [Anaerolineae bacterium]|nr:RNA polymerase sigma factor [Anaerolineae bacterium]